MNAADRVWAIGDLVGGPALAHKATAQAEVAVKAVVGEPCSYDPTGLCAVVYSDPEICSVGVSPEQGKELGMEVARFGHRASARAATTGYGEGTTLLVVDHLGTVCGVHIVGPHASELAGEAALAVEMALTVDEIAFTIHPHPTMTETIAEAALVALGKPLHVSR